MLSPRGLARWLGEPLFNVIFTSLTHNTYGPAASHLLMALVLCGPWEWTDGFYLYFRLLLHKLLQGKVLFESLKWTRVLVCVGMLLCKSHIVFQKVFSLHLTFGCVF